MTEQVTAATDGDILALRNELDTVSAGEILSLVARIDADRAEKEALREAHDHAQEGLRNARKQEQEMRANIAESLQALGLLSTLAGDVVVDPNNLMSMAQEIVKSVNAKIAAMQAEPNRQTILRMSAENASLRERLQVVAQMRDGMKGAVRIKPLVWEEDIADPRLLGEGCCYYVADGTLWFFDPSIHRIKAKLGVQVHLEGRTISDAAQADYEARLIASGVVEPVEVPPADPDVMDALRDSLNARGKR